MAKPTYRDMINTQCPQAGAFVHIVVRFSGQKRDGYTCDNAACPIRGSSDCPLYLSCQAAKPQ